MATTTFSTALAANTWVEVYNGAAAATVGLQVEPGEQGAVAVFVGTSAPSGNTDNYFVLSPAASPAATSSVTLATASGDLVYAMALGEASKVRGYTTV